MKCVLTYLRRPRSLFYLPCKTIRSCIIVAVIVCEIWAFNVCSLNVCHRRKSRPRSSEWLYVQRFSKTQICLVWKSYVNVHARRDKSKLGQATFTDFHKVDVTFVGENVNNTSKYTSLLGGFTVVVISFEISIISGLSNNCVSQSQK